MTQTTPHQESCSNRVHQHQHDHTPGPGRAQITHTLPISLLPNGCSCCSNNSTHTRSRGLANSQEHSLRHNVWHTLMRSLMNRGTSMRLCMHPIGSEALESRTSIAARLSMSAGSGSRLAALPHRAWDGVLQWLGMPGRAQKPRRTRRALRHQLPPQCDPPRPSPAKPQAHTSLR